MHYAQVSTAEVESMVMKINLSILENWAIDPTLPVLHFPRSMTKIMA